MLNLSQDSSKQHVLTSNDVDDALAELLQKQPEIVIDTIDLSGNIVSTATLRHTMDLLVTGPTAPQTVKNLSLSCCGLAEESICSLIEVLCDKVEIGVKSGIETSKPIFQNLDLSYNALNDEDIMAVSEFLFRIRERYLNISSVPPIVELNLRGNCFGNSGLQTILEAKTGLKELDVSYATGLDGASGLTSILCDAMLVHPTLTNMYMGGAKPLLLSDSEWRKVVATGEGNIFSSSASGVIVSDSPKPRREFASCTWEPSASLSSASSPPTANPVSDDLYREVKAVQACSPRAVQPNKGVGEFSLGAHSPRTAVRRLECANKELVEEILEARERIAQLEQRKKKRVVKKKKAADVPVQKEISRVLKPSSTHMNSNVMKKSPALRGLHSDPFRDTTPHGAVKSRTGIKSVPAPEPFMVATTNRRREMF